MNQEKILKLFKRFAGNEIDLHGLKCIPVKVGEEIITNDFHLHQPQLSHHA
jgi:hypothetical protein